jgi:hypothetical protein
MPIMSGTTRLTVTVVGVLGLALGLSLSGCGSSSPDAAGPTSTGADPAAPESAEPTATAMLIPPVTWSPSASGSPRATASPTPRTGKPSRANTGVPAGTKLTIVTGDVTYAKDGTIVEGKDFRGFVRVTGRNITLRNSIFRGRATSSNAALLDTEAGTNTVVTDSEFAPAHPSATLDGIWANHTSIYRADIHGSVDGVKTGSSVLVQDSYIHDMSWFASDPNQGGEPTHNDGVQSFLGDAHVTLRHNTIDMSTTKDANAALQDSASDVRVENNWLDGGGCTLNFNHVNAPLSGLYVTGNRFGRHSFYQCPILLSAQSTLNRNSGNVWDDTGTPIPPPQRHD